MPSHEESRKEVGLPPRAFLYTLDQIGTMVGMTEDSLAKRCVYFDRRTPGLKTRDHMHAVNIAGPDDMPEWRVAERELVRWLKYKGFRVVDRGWASS
jgi:hypothetical protein